MAEPDDAEPPTFRQARFRPPADATRILLVRHGESAPAVPGRPFPLRDGHGDPPLHPDGRVQADRLAARLGADRSITAIYVTTLRRTHETAAPLAAALGLEPAVVPDLREVHLGDWEGGELRIRAAAGDPIFAEVLRQERWDVIPGAETLRAFDERIRRGVATIAAAHPGETVVAVTHGGVIGQLLAGATQSSGFAFAGADNASISEIVVTSDRLVVRRFNDRAHLEG